VNYINEKMGSWSWLGSQRGRVAVVIFVVVSVLLPGAFSSESETAFFDSLIDGELYVCECGASLEVKVNFEHLD